MSGKKKFEPEKINAALKMLRALPVKDNRKTAGEALAMLKGGIQDALDKGYDRKEICKAIAAADLPISPSTFYDFVAANLKEGVAATGMETKAKWKAEQEKTATAPEQSGTDSPVKPESPSESPSESPVAVEQKPAPPATATPESENRNTPDSEPPKPTPARRDKIKLPSYYTPDLPDSEL